MGQNDPKLRISAEIANEYGVGEKTIRRDADFSEAVDKVFARCDK